MVPKDEPRPVTHRIEGEPKGRQTRVLGEGELSQSLGLVPAAQDTQAHKGSGSARIHTHTHTHTHTDPRSGEHAQVAFWQGYSVTQPSANMVTQEPRFSPARQSAQNKSQDLPPGRSGPAAPRSRPPAAATWVGEEELRECVAPAWQFLKGRARGTQGPGRKSLTAVGQGARRRAALCPCSQSGPSGLRSVPMSLEIETKRA